MCGRGALVLVAALAAAMPMRAQSIQAVRINGSAPRLDGRLTEPLWSSAPAITSLTQREPTEGAPAIENTEVRFAYDDDALYVGARMFSANPREIRALVTRRDNEGTSERIVVSLDTYHDRRTAFTFGVTPAGVRLDSYHESDFDDSDEGFDPVWDARARIDSLGWTAEMRIPFTQLRFSPGEAQEWGLNVVRVVPARNEESYWMLIRREETGWSSRMGLLTGIRGIRPARRLEAIPYVAVNSRLQQVDDPADPFQHRSVNGARAGGDLKMGLGPNLTLDATLNPDFGQVEADPATVNLTAFEEFFDERRPFFREGADLLEGRGLFHSRRIGARPPGSANADFAEERDNATILGAAKLTGRLPSGLSVAGLAALTDQEKVRTFDQTSGQFGHALVAPRAMYGIGAAQQEFGEDASTLGGQFTVVHRDLTSGTPLADLLTRTAVSGVMEGRLRWADGEYDVNAWAAVAHVEGDSAAILRQQLSSRRYFQRVDAYRVDPSRRSLSGMYVGVGHSKMAGRHWLWDIDYNHQSPGFEANDAGAFGSVDNRSLSADITWRERQPSRLFRSYEFELGLGTEWNYQWLRRDREGSLSTYLVFPNFWSLNADYRWSGRSFSDRLTRGGPVMGTARNWGGSLELENNEGARTQWSVDIGGDRSEDGGWETGIEMSLSARPNDRLELSFDPEWTRERDMRQYVTTESGGRPETFNSRYVFAAVDVSEISGQLRANYTFTPNLTLETYVEPFAASGRFHNFGELSAPRSRDLLLYGTNGTTITRNPDGSHTVTDGAQSFDIDDEDFNERSFRTNAVLRWEWRLGSTLFLVWQQDRGADLPFAPVRPRHLLDAFDVPGANFVAIKISYWTALR
jgi:hypothetical protein